MSSFKKFAHFKTKSLTKHIIIIIISKEVEERKSFKSLLDLRLAKCVCVYIFLLQLQIKHFSPPSIIDSTAAAQAKLHHLLFRPQSVCLSQF